MEANFAYDGGDNLKNASLLQRISKVNSVLDGLKKQLYVEKNILEKHKREMMENGWSPSGNYYPPSATPGPPKVPQLPSVPLDKTQLREIEKNCELELDKLNNYIFSLGQLKTDLVEFKEKEKQRLRTSKSVKQMEPIQKVQSAEKKYSKGKVFFIDSGLY